MRKASRVLAAFGAAAVLGACSSMSGAMSSSYTEHLTLKGANEVPAVDTPAMGRGTVTIGPDRSVSAKIDVSGMHAVAAHIHQAAMGANGPVIVPLTQTGPGEFVSPPGAKLTEAQYEAYKSGDLYVNVHSPQHKAGEIRAQIEPR